MDIMKFIISKQHAVNLDTIINIAISGNYIILTTLTAREIKFFYGTKPQLDKLFDAIMTFIGSEGRTFDCDKFVATL